MNIVSPYLSIAIDRVIRLGTIRLDTVVLVVTLFIPMAAEAHGQSEGAEAPTSSRPLISDERIDDERGSDTNTLLDSTARERHEVVSRERQRREYLSALRKPVSTIEIEPLDRTAKEPPRTVVKPDDHDFYFISSLGLAEHRPERYRVAFCHEPLYFEQINLERCGHHWGFFQNAVSFAEFFGRTQTLPYHLAANPIGSLSCSPGDCRSCESFDRKSLLPIDRHGALLEAAAIAGFIVLLQ